MTTFGIVDGAQFRSAPPPMLTSPRYTGSYVEVKDVGSVDSQDRPPDRTDVAHFYIISAVQVYNPAARQVSAAQGKTLSENARIFALISMAICDGLISSMESKYFYSRWRPVTAIQAGDTDGNPKTIPDSTWIPLITNPSIPELSLRTRQRGWRYASSARASLRSRRLFRNSHQSNGSGRDPELHGMEADHRRY